MLTPRERRSAERMLRSFSVSFALVISGCGGPVDAPSLAVRPIEQRAETTPAAPTPALKPIDPALAARIAVLSREVSEGDARFTTLESEARRRVSAGRRAATGSEAWIEAEQARSALSAAHQATTSALAELDGLLVAQAESASNDAALGGLSELQAARDSAEVTVARQSAILAGL